MQNLEDSIDVVLSRLFCLLTIGLFLWPFLMVGYVHIEVYLTAVSPVELHKKPNISAFNLDSLQEYGLDSEHAEDTANPPQQRRDPYVVIDLFAREHRIVGIRPDCNGATVGTFSIQSKTFRLDSANQGDTRPFATACFPLKGDESIGFISSNAGSAPGRRSPQHSNGYVVFVPGHKDIAGYALFVLSTKKEAHVFWAPLNESLTKVENEAARMVP